MSPLEPTQALTLFGAVAALLVLLFLIRRRAKRVVVPSLQPWRLVINRRVNPLWKQLLSLALQLLAAALACWALVPESVADEVDAAAPPLAIVDASASMAADGRIEAAAEWARSLGGGVLLAGDEVQVLVPPGSVEGRVESGLRRIRAGSGGARIEDAMALARQLGHEPVVLSDRAVGDEWRVVGPGGADVAIQEVVASAGPGLPPEYAVSVRVENHGADPVTVDVQLETQDSILGKAPVELPPGEAQLTTFRMDPVPGDWVMARLVEHDDVLPENDAAYGVLPGLRPASVVLVSRGNRYLEDLFRVLPGLSLRVVSPDRYRRPSGVDLVIFDRAAPAGALPDAAVWFIDPPVGASPAPPAGWAGEAEFTTWDFSHDLLRGVALRHLAVEQLRVLKASRNASVLASSDDGPAIVVGEDPKVLVMGFDLTRSDLPLTIAFPQLVYNVLMWAREDAVGAPPPSSVSASRGIALDPGQGAVVERLDAPGFWELPAGQATLDGTGPGVYRVVDRLGERLVAVNFDPAEHGRLATGEAPAVVTSSDEAPVERPRLVLLALAAMSLLLVEFLVAVR